MKSTCYHFLKKEQISIWHLLKLDPPDTRIKHVDWKGGPTVLNSLFKHVDVNKLPPYLDKACKMFPISVFKIIRATLDLITPVIRQNPDIRIQTKIVVLMRDPRSVMLVKHSLCFLLVLV